MEISVKNQSGEAVETIDLDDAVFNVPMNHALVHQATVIYQLNKRQGTHDTKTRAQVSGGGRKPWIQKHTGRARQGSIRAPQWRHGGVVFGPHPRSYRKSLPRRMRHQALRCVLSEKARHDRLICLNSTDTVDGKTKSMVSLLKNLGISGSALVITRESDQTVVRAAHNLNKIWTLPVALLNAQELLRRDTVIMTIEAARWAEQFLASELRRGGGPRMEAEPEAPGDQEAQSGEEATTAIAEAEAPEADVAESEVEDAPEALEEEASEEEATEEASSPVAELEEAGPEPPADNEAEEEAAAPDTPEEDVSADAEEEGNSK